MERVNVVGLGYIGLPTALMMASHGVPVVGTDSNAGVIHSLQKGKLTFEERGMEELFRCAVSKDIAFSDTCEKTRMYIICVPTPYDKVTKKIDPDYVITAIRNVLQVCERGSVLVIESTVSPGTIDRYIRPILEENGWRTGTDIHLVHAPERIIPGNVVGELLQNSRTIGADDSAVGARVKEIYESFCRGEILLTDIRTAEMSKVVENTYRDVNIAFANELAKICRSGGVDVYEVIRIANHHPRVNILAPGPGVGGHCISVDPWFLVGDFPEQTHIIRQAREINDSMPEYVLDRIWNITREIGVRDPGRIGFYGLTYKENVDDTRESPTLQLFERMACRLFSVPKCYDPLCRARLSAGQFRDFDAFLAEIDLLVIMVNHRHLKQNWDKVRNKAILDTRNSGLESGSGNRFFFL